MKQSRREMLKLTGRAVATTILAPSFARSADKRSSGSTQGGGIIGETAGAEVGARMLAEGANAIDALIAAALVSCVAAPSRCGLAGYGGHMTIALAGGSRVTAIDFNSMAPKAARPDMYSLDEHGKALNDANFHGWLAVGVPG